MTSVLSWFDKGQEHTNVWVVGDSLISQRGSSQKQALLEYGAKIFSIPVICRKPRPQKGGSLSEDIFFYAPIGLAYAGSSLVGLNVYSVLTTALSNLFDIGEPPSLSDIARYAKNIIERYTKDLAVTQQNSALCEMMIVGYCLIEKCHKIIHLVPDFTRQGAFVVLLNEFSHDLVEDDFVCFIGDHKSDICQKISSLRSGLPQESISWQRAPKNVLRTVIRDRTYDSIGGQIQLGISTTSGFRIYASAESDEENNDRHYLDYLGFDTMSRYIGNCPIGIWGMSHNDEQ